MRSRLQPPLPDAQSRQARTFIAAAGIPTATMTAAENGAAQALTTAGAVIPAEASTALTGHRSPSTELIATPATPIASPHRRQIPAGSTPLTQVPPAPDTTGQP